LVEFKKATFLVVARHCELTFCLFTSPKFDLHEVQKSMNQVFECHFEAIFYFLITENATFFQVDKATIQVVEWELKVFSASSQAQNSTS